MLENGIERKWPVRLPGSVKVAEDGSAVLRIRLDASEYRMLEALAREDERTVENMHRIIMKRALRSRRAPLILSDPE